MSKPNLATQALIMAMTATLLPMVSTAQEAAEAAPKRALKLVAIGDSITQGGWSNYPEGVGTYEYSYRYPLWKNFVDAEWEVEMVGTVKQGFVKHPEYADYKGKKFDNSNEGYWGWPLMNPGKEESSIKHKIEQNLKGGKFDVAILEAGWNDLNQLKKKDEFPNEAAYNAACAEEIARRAKTVIELLQSINENAAIYYSALPATWEPQTSVNAALKKMIGELPEAKAPVVFVDMPAAWVNKPDEPNTCTYDWVHTNERGDKMLADAYFGAMKPFVEAFYKKQE